MSYSITPVQGALAEYVLENFSCEDALLKELTARSLEAKMPQINISPEQGLFLQFYLKSINAKRVVEIGTLGGYSAIIMARALPEDGKLTTVEMEPRHADFAREMVELAGLGDRIDVVTQDGRQFVENYSGGENSLDFVFVDADKPSYAKYLDKLTPAIRKGGAFAADNAFAFGFVADSAPERDPREIKSIKSFNAYFKSRKEFFTSIVGVGDGIIIGLKL
ncbi:MAG: O-methyltransferase [Chloroflexota bacterium]